MGKHDAKSILSNRTFQQGITSNEGIFYFEAASNHHTGQIYFNVNSDRNMTQNENPRHILASPTSQRSKYPFHLK